MKLIDADKLKSFVDKMPEEEEGEYQRLYEQVRWERDMLEDQLDQSVSTYFLEKWLGKNLYEKLIHDYEHQELPFKIGETE